MPVFDLTNPEERAAFDARRWAFEDAWGASVVARIVACGLPGPTALEATAVVDWGVTMEDLGYPLGSEVTVSQRAFYERLRPSAFEHRADQREALGVPGVGSGF